MTFAQFKKELADRIQIEKLGDQVTKDIKASDKEVKEYYEKNKASFAVKDQVQVAHILVQEEEKAKKILSDVRAGADFSKLAKEHSIDPGSKDKGGEMPMTDKDQFVPEFAEASWKLEPGQISELVKTTYGFHIIKMIAKKNGGEKKFEDIKDEVEEQMLSADKQETFGKWLDELKAKAKIERYLDANPPQAAPGAAPGGVPGAVPPADQGAPQNTVPQTGK
jgi:foldase protein PrsA